MIGKYTVMNDDFAKFIDSLAELAGKPFESGSTFYNEPGDMIEVLLSTEEYYAKRVDNILTILIGENSGEIVGYHVKNASRLFEKAVEGMANTKELPPRMD